MAWDTDQRFPEFTIDGVRFLLTFQEDDFGTKVLLMQRTGETWIGSRVIVANFGDADILAKGGVHAFLTWACDEALRQAREIAQLPLPNPNDRIARLKYNLLMSVDWDEAAQRLAVKPAPLP